MSNLCRRNGGGMEIDMDLKNIKWIFFDMGFTLIDESDEHRRRAALAIDMAVRRGNKRISVEEFEALMYKLGADGTPPFRRACHMIGADYIPYTGECESVYPEADHVLNVLSKKYKLGIIANQLPGAAERLHRFGLDKYLSIIISSAEFGAEKPDTSLFYEALRLAGCDAHNAVMVGDRPDNDIVPARAVGMRTIRIKQGQFGNYSPSEPALCADFEIASLDMLPGLFEI